MGIQCRLFHTKFNIGSLICNEERHHDNWLVSLLQYLCSFVYCGDWKLDVICACFMYSTCKNLQNHNAYYVKIYLFAAQM